MVEGQEDVTWERWVALAAACEEHGLEGLFRSDHYVSVFGREERGSLDAWATIMALAARTERIRLGALVSPVTFRHPAVLAKTVTAADHVSGGRVELGLGAGWHLREHQAFGFPFPPEAERMAMLAEQLEVIHGLWSEDPFSFEGRHFRLVAARGLPRPIQRPHPPIILGGAAGPRSAALAARWADEYNVVSSSVDECRTRREAVARAWEAEDRDPAMLRFSLMTGCVVGTDRADVRRRAGRVASVAGEGDAEAFIAEHPQWLIGTVAEVVGGLRQLEDAEVGRVMLQHLDAEDLEMVELLGREVAPQVA
jgi:F420-dependent oxidoreductase-like protein